MPRGDRTGPMGMGPQTGRAAGYCAGYGVPGFMNPVYGRGGMGYGARGRGRGRRNWYHATGLTGWQRAAAGWPAVQGFGPGAFADPHVPVYAPAYPGLSREQELGVLRGQAEAMEQSLKEAQERIAELESETQSSGESS